MHLRQEEKALSSGFVRVWVCVSALKQLQTECAVTDFKSKKKRCSANLVLSKIT